MNEIVVEARRWLGTPYVHQAASCGAGSDCLGLIRGIWRMLFGEEPTGIPAYTADWSEPQRDETLMRTAAEHLVPLAMSQPFRPGEVLLFRMKRGAIAKHLGVVAEPDPLPTFIHAYSGHAVVESSLSNPWRNRIAARFEFPKTIQRNI